MQRIPTYPEWRKDLQPEEYRNLRRKGGLRKAYEALVKRWQRQGERFNKEL